MRAMQKRWIIPESRELPTGAGVASYLGMADVPPAILRILANRGFEGDGDLAAFLHPSWDTGIHDPFLFSHMEEATERLFTALENGERITVHGDYDADGVTGSAVIITTLRAIAKQTGSAATIDSYIPHRDKEGYGLNPTSVRSLKERGTQLIITVDCGIANVDEIALARSLGMDVIVVDHHTFGDDLPNGILIHPKLPGEAYPFPHLAAVGVAWKLASALVARAAGRNIELTPGFEKWLLDFVSIATVTDMVPIIGENRVLETYGLTVLNKTRRPGLRKLIEVSGYAPGTLTTESVAFGLGPRINAAGRMDHASLALRLLLAETEDEATELAGEIEAKNRERQKATARIMTEAEKQLEKMAGAPALAFWSTAWPPALVGLVAGRFLDRTGKPAIAIGRHGDRWVGSGRSFAAYDITEAMKRAGKDLLEHVGGHVQACGFSWSGDIPPDVLCDALIADAQERLAGADLRPTLEIDATLEIDELGEPLVAALDQMEPFGIGNPKPLFISRDLEVVSRDLVGAKQDHVRCVLRAPSGRHAKFIGFKFGPRVDELSFGQHLDVVYDVGINEWNGRRDVQCKLVDIRKAEGSGGA